jgi:hypothetical protein
MEPLPQFVRAILTELENAWPCSLSRVELLSRCDGYWSKYFGAWTKPDHRVQNRPYSHLVRATNCKPGSLEFVITDAGRDALRRDAQQ